MKKTENKKTEKPAPVTLSVQNGKHGVRTKFNK